MKNLLLVLGLVLSFASSAQWNMRDVDNDFDDPYRIAYTQSGKVLLKLENLDGKIWLYILSEYTCDEELVVDVSFIVNGVAKKYSFYGLTSDDKQVIFFIEDLLNEDCLSDFKSCSSVKIRINDTTCGSEIHQFNMSGSTSALKFILNQ